jgi:hypothetical protein
VRDKCGEVEERVECQVFLVIISIRGVREQDVDLVKKVQEMEGSIEWKRLRQKRA